MIAILSITQRTGNTCDQNPDKGMILGTSKQRLRMRQVFQGNMVSRFRNIAGRPEMHDTARTVDEGTPGREDETRTFAGVQ